MPVYQEIHTNFQHLHTIYPHRTESFYRRRMYPCSYFALQRQKPNPETMNKLSPQKFVAISGTEIDENYTGRHLNE